MEFTKEEKAILRIAGRAYLKEIAGMKRRANSLSMIKMYDEDIEALESAIEKLQSRRGDKK